MKKNVSILLTLSLALTLALSVSADNKELTVAKGTPTIDGEIDEVWSTTPQVQLGYLKAGDLKGDGTLPETSAAYARVLWDENALYFLFEVVDDDWSIYSDVGDWKNDSIYLYIDELESCTATWVDGQSQIALVPEDDWSMVPRKGTAPASYEMAYSYPSDNLCVIEFKYVPALLEPGDLAEGFEFMADFQYNDADDMVTRPYCFGWCDENDNASNDSTGWGFITLGGEGTPGTSSNIESGATAAPAETEAEAEPVETVEETAAPETEAPVAELETQEPVETVEEATAPETVEAVEEETVEAPAAPAESAPQTFDAAVIAAVAAVASLCGYSICKKRT